jgi:hypothetical protein
MSLESPGAVLRLEVRPVVGARPASSDQIDARLAEAKRLLETGVAPGRWEPEAPPGVRGRIRFERAADAFPMLHDLRSALRADPSPVALDLVAGLGAGDEAEGLRRSADAVRALGQKRRQLTRAVTGDTDADVVLSALCRMLDNLIGGWTDAQWQAVHRRDRGLTLQQIGEELGIAYQNVSKRLIAARYSLYQDVLGAASLVFSKNTRPRL